MDRSFTLALPRSRRLAVSPTPGRHTQMASQGAPWEAQDPESVRSGAQAASETTGPLAKLGPRASQRHSARAPRDRWDFACLGGIPARLRHADDYPGHFSWSPALTILASMVSWRKLQSYGAMDSQHHTTNTIQSAPYSKHHTTNTKETQ